MFIVHSVGSNEDNPFKVFSSAAAAVKFAESKSYEDVERVFVYEWAGDREEGLAAARAGSLEALTHFSRREKPTLTPPERPFRPSPKSEELAKEFVKKMPRLARKF